MLIRVAKGREPRLEQPGDFMGFKLVAEGARADLPDLQAAFAPAGRITDDQHAWVREDWIRSQAPDCDDPAWQGGFQRMLGYAAKKGWLGEDGAIRAHIEWAE